MSNHTPPPWEINQYDEKFYTIDSADKGVGEAYSKENAEFIVRAVNNHERLVEALEFCLHNPRSAEAKRRATQALAAVREE